MSSRDHASSRDQSPTSVLAFPAGSILYRLFEILPGSLTWGTIVGAILLARFEPILLANLIILFDVFWLYRSLRFAIFAWYAFRKLRRFEKIDWFSQLETLETSPGAPPRQMKPSEVFQAIILVHYKESYELLRRSIASYAASAYPTDTQVFFLLASEERAGAEAVETFRRLNREFGRKFFRFEQTIHPPNLPGEIKGKSANATWAGQSLQRTLDGMGVDYQRVLVHNFDADTRVHPQYFAHVTLRFLETPRHEVVSYQPVHIYSNNIWDAPAIIRIVATSSTTIFLHNMLRPHRFRNFSSRTDCFQTIIDIDFWPRDVIPEDSRQYWNMFFLYRHRPKIVPIFVPLRMDAVLANGYFRTIQNQYQQLRRWAWGVVDVPYVVSRALKDRTIPGRLKFHEILRLIESHYSWANTSLIITLYGWYPFIFGQQFDTTVLGFNLPVVARNILTLAIVGLLVTVWVSFFFYQPRPEHQPTHGWLKFVWQWIWMPVASIFFSSAAAIDAQTRLMLGRYLEYQVAEKVIKHPAHT